MNNILLVDDDERVLFSLRRLLGRIPCTCEDLNFKLKVEVFHDPLEAIEYVRHHALDLVIADYRMPQMDGIPEEMPRDSTEHVQNTPFWTCRSRNHDKRD